MAFDFVIWSAQGQRRFAFTWTRLVASISFRSVSNSFRFGWILRSNSFEPRFVSQFWVSVAVWTNRKFGRLPPGYLIEIGKKVATKLFLVCS